nr:HNH endonuclease [Colwellia psychrerythraea]
MFENKVHIGEMAHIIAKSNQGPRGDTNLENLNTYQNLILLCANDHTAVDKNTEYYTVDRLLSIKEEHENKVSSTFVRLPQEFKNDCEFLSYFMNFVPFTQLLSFIYLLPNVINIDFSKVSDILETSQIDIPHLYPLNDSMLQNKFYNFISQYYELWGVITGVSVIDGREQANFTSSDDNNLLNLDTKYLPYESIASLKLKLENLSISFTQSYTDLTNFLRTNYKEVDLNAYTPMKF